MVKSTVTTRKVSCSSSTLNHLAFKLKSPKIRLKVIGLGGGGNSIVSELSQNLKGIEFLAANTDLKALKKASHYCKTFAFGEKVTFGFGTGMDPELGQKAAQSSQDKIASIFKKTDLVIFIVCLGGGTGSGALPIFAESAKKAGSLVLGIFTLPFSFEGQKKLIIARETILKVEPYFNGVLLISNDKIFNIIDKKTPLPKALSQINSILLRALTGLIDVLRSPGLINIDFSDLKTVLQGFGKQIYLASEIAEGQAREETVLKLLFEQPLFLNKLSKPKSILLNVAGGRDLKISELEKLALAIYKLNPASRIIFGIQYRQSLENKIKATILAINEGQIIPKEFLQELTQTQIESKEKAITKKEESKKEVKETSLETGKNFGQGGELKKDVQAEIKKSNLRKTALDLKKETKKLEQEFIKEEQKWDVPAFLKNKNWKIALQGQS